MNLINNYDEHIKYIEESTGLNQTDFNDKCYAWAHNEETLKRAMSLKDVLDDWLYAGVPILSTSKDELQLEDGEYFAQVFRPDIPFLRELPVEWFVSNYGNMVSVQDGMSTCYLTEPMVTWLPPKYKGESDCSRSYQKFQHRITKKQKSIPYYILLALVFNPDAVLGTARQMLDKYGTYATGGLSIYDVQGHHILPWTAYPDYRHDPGNIQIITKRLHDIMHNIRNGSITEQELVRLTQAEFLDKDVYYLTNQLINGGKSGGYSIFTGQLPDNIEHGRRVIACCSGKVSEMVT